MSLTLLTPLGLLVGLAGIVPLIALHRTRRRAQAVREALHLDPVGGKPWPTYVGVVALSALLALAVAQPAVRHTDDRRVRKDAQAYFVFDISRSMLASAAPGEPSRLDRAERLALRVRSKLEDVPAGVATLTDRVLPDLFPTSDDEVLTATIEQSVGIDAPPPRTTDIVTTCFCAFDTMAGDNFFDATAKRRLVVFFTDGESAPYDRDALRQVFIPSTEDPGSVNLGPDFGSLKLKKPKKVVPTRFVTVRLWKQSERIWVDGKLAKAYQPDPNSSRITQEFASTVDGKAFEESQIEDAIAAARDYVGKGTIEASGQTLRVVPLAKWFVLAALIPLVGLLWRRNLV